MKTLSVYTAGLFALVLVLGSVTFAADNALAGPNIAITPSATSSGISIDPADPLSVPLPANAAAVTLGKTPVALDINDRSGLPFILGLATVLLAVIIVWAVRSAQFQRTHPKTTRPAGAPDTRVYS